MITKETTLNGVDVSRLEQTIQAIKQEPKLADFKFRARNRWKTGGQNQAVVDTFYGTCEEQSHKEAFHMKADEPAVLLGEDTGANPVEYVLAGLSGCMTTTLAYHAAARGLEISSISSEYEGDIDLRGLLDIDPNVPSGYQQIRVKFKVSGDIDEATVKELVQKSPVFDTLRRPIDIRIEVEKA
jgi:uncharacterized OsmC-like protein